jgi:hypothetical protein
MQVFFFDKTEIIIGFLIAPFVHIFNKLICGYMFAQSDVVCMQAAPHLWVTITTKHLYICHSSTVSTYKIFVFILLINSEY